MMVPNRDTMKLANYKLNLKIQFHRVNYVIYTVYQYYGHCSLTHQKLSKAPSSTPSTLPPPPRKYKNHINHHNNDDICTIKINQHVHNYQNCSDMCTCKTSNLYLLCNVCRCVEPSM